MNIPSAKRWTVRPSEAPLERDVESSGALPTNKRKTTRSTRTDTTDTDTRDNPPPLDSLPNGTSVAEDSLEEYQTDSFKTLPSYLEHLLREVEKTDGTNNSNELDLSEKQLAIKYTEIESVRSAATHECAQWENEKKINLIKLQEEAFEKAVLLKRKRLHEERRRVSLELENFKEKRAKLLGDG
jgi:hypothetical protein